MEQTTLDIYKIIDELQDNIEGFIVNDVEYFESSLSASYVLFLNDVFQNKYGAITRGVIERFGSSNIKTTKEAFHKSYSSVIKEIKLNDGNLIYIRIGMTKKEIRKSIDGLAAMLSIKVKHYNQNKIT